MTFQLVVILKALNEVALMAFLGQAALFALAGNRRQGNFAYQLLSTLTAPIVKATRALAPRFIVDQHIGFLAFFLLLVIEALLIVLKIWLFLQAQQV
ncbi:MAG: hypothetical protein ACRET8_01905 [Burkholderiales bacterium]